MSKTSMENTIVDKKKNDARLLGIFFFFFFLRGTN